MSRLAVTPRGLAGLECRKSRRSVAVDGLEDLQVRARSSAFTLAGTAVRVTVAAGEARSATAADTALRGGAILAGGAAAAADCGADVGAAAATFMDGEPRGAYAEGIGRNHRFWSRA